ncbi:WbqC family protein [Halosquirtibacter xylanolyticus]|uniref:WbqC family protein n=1 Tax=Halosquirtibacter xylanolyticus TaxID=3374599 RepID=UPI003749E74B|nr:WbqC family protein [Prolixibacteraceae bacterium]
MEQDITRTILATSYLGNIHHYFYRINAEAVVLEDIERYKKQTFRNRCQILGANGIQNLTVPVIAKNHSIIRDVKISYDIQWQKQHWKAMLAAYNHSPYFEYYRDYFEPFYQKKYDFLWDFNMEIESVVLDLLDESKPFELFSQIGQEGTAVVDRREAITPKKPVEDTNFLQKPYRQMMFSKGMFIPNLSIVDLLFNQGTESYLYLS